MKYCPRCDLEKEDVDFSKRKLRSGKEILQSICKLCNKLAHKKHYIENKQDYIDKAKKNTLKNVEFVNKLKEESPCKDCSKFYPSYVMDFDHVLDKLYGIANIVRAKSRKTLLEEIAKCEIVCSNCHRIRTHNRIYGTIS